MVVTKSTPTSSVWCYFLRYLVCSEGTESQLLLASVRRGPGTGREVGGGCPLSQGPQGARLSGSSWAQTRVSHPLRPPTDKPSRKSSPLSLGSKARSRVSPPLPFSDPSESKGNSGIILLESKLNVSHLTGSASEGPGGPRVWLD